VPRDRLDPAVVSARRRAAGISGAAGRWGRATNGAPAGRGRAAQRRTHQPIQVPRPDAFHTATPRDQLTPDRQWYRIQDAITGGAVDVYIYDEIGFWGVTAQDFVLELQQVQATQLNVHINSPGGEVFDGIAIYNALVNHPAEVHVTVDALAASIASVITMAGDTITMGRHSQLMIHEPYGMCVGNADDMTMMIAQLNMCADNIAGAYADRAGGTVEAWREAMRAESWYTGAEAVTAGLADAVVANPRQQGGDDGDTLAARWDLGVFQFAGRQEAPAPDLTVAKRRKPRASDTAATETVPASSTPTAVPAPAPDPLDVLLDLAEPDPLLTLAINLKEAAS
jgi:ATP-dependent protease ClpP protease subunit